MQKTLGSFFKGVTTPAPQSFKKKKTNIGRSVTPHTAPSTKKSTLSKPAAKKQSKSTPNTPTIASFWGQSKQTKTKTTTQPDNGTHVIHPQNPPPSLPPSALCHKDLAPFSKEGSDEIAHVGDDVAVEKDEVQYLEEDSDDDDVASMDEDDGDYVDDEDGQPCDAPTTLTSSSKSSASSASSSEHSKSTTKMRRKERLKATSRPLPRPPDLTTFPKDIAYKDFASKLLRSGVVMEAVGVQWSTFKDLHAPKPPTPKKKPPTAVPSKRAPPSPPSSPDSPAPNNGMSKYELLRLEKIKRNNAYLEKLGLGSGLIPSEDLEEMNRAKKKKKKRKKTIDPEKAAAKAAPARRSARNRGEIAVDYSQEKIVQELGLDLVGGGGGGRSGGAAKIVKGNDDFDENAVVIHNDDVVLKYDTAPERLGGTAKSGDTSVDSWWATIDSSTQSTSVPALHSFRSPQHFGAEASKKGSPATLATSAGLQKLYDLNFSSGGKFIVGGGGDGMVNVWGLEDDEEEEGGEGGEDELYEEGKAARTEWCWRASKNWLSGAEFFPSEGAVPKLLTTANDGVMRLWDLAKVLKSGGPKELLAAPNVHRTGIFSMDLLRKEIDGAYHVATGSKDKTVAVTAIRGEGGSVNVVWRGEYHDKIVKDVSFCKGKGSTLVASCGMDGVVAISDWRVAGGESASVVEIENGHSTPHSVVWGEGCLDEGILMTAGACSDVIKIWDIKNAAEPIMTLRGHTNSTMRKRGIHHPAFFSPTRKGGGRTFVVSGGDHVGALSIFDITEGSGAAKGGEINAASRGKIGDGNLDVSALSIEKDEEGYGFRLAAASGEQIHLLKGVL